MHRFPHHRRSRTSPARTFVVVLALVFLVEAVIMLVLPHLVPWPRGSLAESATDALLLAGTLAPALWFLVVRPLRDLYRERGALLQQVFDAQEQERTRIARDLHDELGQHLTAVLVGLRALQDGADSELVRARAGDLLRMTTTGLREVHRLVSGLRPGVLDDFGLRVALERLGEDFHTSYGIPVRLSVALASGARYAREVEATAYRVVQESLTNVARHAHATGVDARVFQGGDRLRIEISDDGRGASGGPGPDRGVGVTSMRERVELLGGSFSLVSGVDRGTRVEVALPAHGAPAEAGGAPR